MPIYEYEREDGTRFEKLCRNGDDDITVCPETGQKVRRVISKSAFHLKGSGWYKTDYASSGSGGSAASKSSSESTSASSEASTSKDSSSGDSTSSSGSDASCTGTGPSGGCKACSD